VVIPTVVGWSHLEASLPPLLVEMGGDDEVVVVADNCDVTLPPTLETRCRVVVHRGRRGFGPACNFGVQESTGALVLLLNDDVTVCPRLLASLAAQLARPEVAAVSPNLISQRLGRSESSTTLRWHHGVLEARQQGLEGDGRIAVPYLCGAALAVRREDFLRAGGFDERLAPYYWEDLDLSLRLRKGGGDTFVLAGLAVAHRHGATIDREPGLRRRRLYERNRLLVTWKNLEGRAWFGHLLWELGRAGAGLLRSPAVPLGLLDALLTVARRRGGHARRD
jgi:GT2 family glycosyltransferase